jgi:hypothetical protein
VSGSELKEGVVYFSVGYVDQALLIPTVEAVVFIGRDLEPGDSGRAYFQDFESHARGVRYGVASEEDGARFFMGPEGKTGHIFEYQRALEELMRCSLRREKKAG